LTLLRSRVRLPPHSCGAAFFPDGTKRFALPFLGLFLILPTLLLVFPGPGSRAGVTPIIWSLNLRNRAPWSGLAAKSPIMSPVGHHTTDTSSFLTRSAIKKYRMLMCFMRLLLEAFPFLSKRIELLLSWNKTLSLKPYPCAFIKYRVQQMAGMKSSAPTISVSVELRVFIFCFVELTIGNTRPSDSPPPE
jgi:hypothetical protein